MENEVCVCVCVALFFCVLALGGKFMIDSGMSVCLSPKQTSFSAQEYGGAAVGTVVRSVWAELGPPQVGCAGGRGRTLQGHSPWNRWRLWNDEGRVKGR